jgi:hypothetical protein
MPSARRQQPAASYPERLAEILCAKRPATISGTNVVFYQLCQRYRPMKKVSMQNFEDHHRRIREGNAEAIGAASALFAVLIVGGFLFFSLKTSESDIKAGLQIAPTSQIEPTPGVTPATTGASASR